MKLYNTFSRQVETFEPRGKEVTVYVCGITPYDTTHLGHAFTYTSMDVLIRYLELRELKVKYVQNVTDIDDDILRKAGQVGEDWKSLGNRWTSLFIRDMQNLNVRPPDEFPRATSVIPDIIRGVEKLIDAGVAYPSGGSVYYDVSRYPQFGALSQLSHLEMLPVANERGNRPNDPHKRDPLDFVLWQAQAPGEPSWDSPWGPGRPGWHIECSTLSTKYLGDTVDIHGGGADLCFPHHECEIAQVMPVRKNKPFVRFWAHTAMVYHDGEKMSKSLGNLVMVRDLIQEYPPDALRLYLGNHHYRDSWSYKEKDLKKAQASAEMIKVAAAVKNGKGPVLNAEDAWARFTSAMDNDLDTPTAIGVIERLADDIIEAGLVHRDVAEAQAALFAFAKVFGLRLNSPDSEERVVSGWEKHAQEFA